MNRESAYATDHRERNETTKAEMTPLQKAEECIVTARNLADRVVRLRDHLVGAPVDAAGVAGSTMTGNRVSRPPVLVDLQDQAYRSINAIYAAGSALDTLEDALQLIPQDHPLG